MWKNLKGYFIVEEEGPKKSSTLPPKAKSGKAAAPQATPPANNPPPASTIGSGLAGASPASGPTTPATGAVNDRSVKVLMQAMENANQPGFDYLEFKKSLQNLKKMNFTDEVRFQTAYATAQSMGVTPEQLQSSAGHYLSVLQKEQQKFAAALNGQRVSQISNKQDRLKQMDASIQQQEAKIKELQEKIAKARKEQEKLRDTIAQSSEKLEQTQADFEATLRVITGGIEQDVENMKTFLK